MRSRQRTHSVRESRLVIQAFNDEGKKNCVDSTNDNPRVSQRSLCNCSVLLERGITLHLRDITQAYVQSTSTFDESSMQDPERCDWRSSTTSSSRLSNLCMASPKAGTHWFGTYHKHHREKLGMGTSTYGPCLLITKMEMDRSARRMQNDDTLILGDNELSSKTSN